MRFCSLIVIALFAAGCSQGGAAAVQDENAPVKIETSQMYVTIRNQAGLPLTDLSVAIVPRGRATLYTSFIGRLENSESRDLMLGDFVGRDGTPFSLRVANPRSVEVTATDVTGREYTAEVPWR